MCSWNFGASMQSVWSLACPNLGTVSELSGASLSGQVPTSLHHIWKWSFKVLNNLFGEQQQSISLVNNSNHQSSCSATIWCRDPDSLCVSPGMLCGCLIPLWAYPEAPESCQPLASCNGARAWLTFWTGICKVPNSTRRFGTCHPKWRKVPPCRASGTSDTASLADLVIPCSFYCCGASHCIRKAGSQQRSSSLYQNCNLSVAMYLLATIFLITSAGSVSGTSCLKDDSATSWGTRCITSVRQQLQVSRNIDPTGIIH